MAPFHVPWGKAEDFKGFINVVDMFAREYNGKECVAVEMPDDMHSQIDPIRDMLLESVAETDEELMDKFFNGETFTKEEITKGLRMGVLAGDIIPVLCGSTVKNIGVHTLMDMVVDYLPTPLDTGLPRYSTVSVAQVFKTVIDPFLGRVS